MNKRSTSSDWRQLPSTTGALRGGGWSWRAVVAWDKTGVARPTKGRFTQQAKFVEWGSKGKMPDDRQVLTASNIIPGELCHRVDPSDQHHVTGKPTALMFDLVRIYEPGGIILDPFADSGTTEVAALRPGYRFIDAELNREYFDIASQRLDRAAQDEWLDCVQQLPLSPTGESGQVADGQHDTQGGPNGSCIY